MFRFLALVLALSAVAYGAVPNSRIVGGDSTHVRFAPWTLSLRRNGLHFCGATLVSSTWAVSSARCTANEDVSELTLLGGTPFRLVGGQVRQVDTVVKHPDFDSVSFVNDISLIRVDTAFELDENLRAANLPAEQGETVATGASGLLSGWGTVVENDFVLPLILQVAEVPVVDQDTCSATYYGNVNSDMLCAGELDGSRGACHGDVGSSFVIDGVLQGIVSWGLPCARDGFPGVYTRVSSFRNFIGVYTGV